MSDIGEMGLDNLVISQDERSTQAGTSGTAENVVKLPKKLSRKKSPVQKLKKAAKEKSSKNSPEMPQAETNMKAEQPEAADIEIKNTSTVPGLKASPARGEKTSKKAASLMAKGATTKSRSSVKAPAKKAAKPKVKAASVAKSKKDAKNASTAKKTPAVSKKTSKVSPAKKASVKKSAAKPAKKKSAASSKVKAVRGRPKKNLP